MQIDATVLDAAGNVIGSGIILEDGIVKDILPPAEEPTGPYLFPGFVDVHCHGGGGASFPDDTDDDSIERAAAVHSRAGTVRLVGSLVSTHDPLPAIEALVRACDRGTLAGIHLEGPFISPDKAGAQDPSAIRAVDLDELRSWLDAGRGWIKTMTLAPERENATAAAALLLARGAVPSWGHTSADGEVTRRAVEAVCRMAETRPAQTATHLFNAMPPLHHRAPGPVRELLDAANRSDAVVEIIGDGIHVDLDLVADVITHLDDPVSPGAALVTDAMAGAGMPDGEYLLGGLDVTITGGVAYLSGTEMIAGGTSTLVQQVIALLERGMDPAVAARAACLAPSRAIGIDPPASPAFGQPLTGVLIDGKDFRVWRDGALVGNACADSDVIPGDATTVVWGE